jgi:sulfur carrier protein
MNIHIHQRPFDLPESATVTDALAAFGAKPPFAVALNGQFVARAEHASKALSTGDKLDVVAPVAGG